MKRNHLQVLAILLVAFTLMLLTSCSTSDKKDTPTVLRGKDINTNIIVPLYTNLNRNVYKIGDTVWAEKQEKQGITCWGISAKTWSTTATSEYYRVFIIEEDNDILEQINYKDSIRR